MILREVSILLKHLSRFWVRQQNRKPQPWHDFHEKPDIFFETIGTNKTGRDISELYSNAFTRRNIGEKIETLKNPGWMKIAS